jgi:hypothetical protein
MRLLEATSGKIRFKSRFSKTCYTTGKRLIGRCVDLPNHVFPLGFVTIYLKLFYLTDVSEWSYLPGFVMYFCKRAFTSS